MLDSPLLTKPSRSKFLSKATAALAVIILILTVYAVNTHTPSSAQQLSLFDANKLEFETFRLYYGRQYRTEEEYQVRLKIFQENLAYIRMFNSFEKSIVLSVNNFADLSIDEFKAKFRPSNLNERKIETIDDPFDQNSSLPEYVDWRNQGAVTAVKSQGDCGSCYAFSATGAIESAWFLAGNPLVSLSEQQIVDCSYDFFNDGCNGGYFEQAYSYVIYNKGITSEANYPYTELDGVCNRAKSLENVASISSFVMLTPFKPNLLKAAVAMQPVSVSVESSSVSWQFYSSGTMLAYECSFSFDHDLLIIGYDARGRTPFWILKNSWGVDWGIAGFMQIAITPGPGVCGINSYPGYPIV